MNRRLFLKALAVSPIVPSVLCAKEKPKATLTLRAGTDKEVTYEWKPCMTSSTVYNGDALWSVWFVDENGKMTEFTDFDN